MSKLTDFADTLEVEISPDEPSRVLESFGSLQDFARSLDEPSATDLGDLAVREARSQKERSWWGRVSQAWQRGDANIAPDFVWDEAWKGNISKDQARKADERVKQINLDDPVEGRNWFEDNLLKTVQIARPMVDAESRGILIGSGAGTAVGLTPGGQTFAVPAFFVGQRYGSFDYWYRHGRGNLYRELSSEEIPDKTAKPLAMIGGAIYAGIEFINWNCKFIPGWQKFAGKPIKNTAKRALLSYAKRVGLETTEEGLQEISNEAFTTVGKLLEERIQVANVPDETKKALSKAKDAVLEAAVPIAFLGAPGGAVELASARTLDRQLTRVQEELEERGIPIPPPREPTTEQLTPPSLTTEEAIQAKKEPPPVPPEVEMMRRERERRKPPVTSSQEAGIEGLRAEVQKYDTFEEFEKAWLSESKHGQYWHLTEDPNFTISPEKGPRDMSSLAQGEEDRGALMVTSHLEHWAEGYGETRPYAALIDMSNVAKDDYYQVKRGFGNEFFVKSPQNARVVEVMPLEKARQLSAQWDQQKPQSREQLKEFYEQNRAEKLPTETLVEPKRYNLESVLGVTKANLKQMIWRTAEGSPEATSAIELLTGNKGKLFTLEELDRLSAWLSPSPALLESGEPRFDKLIEKKEKQYQAAVKKLTELTRQERLAQPSERVVLPNSLVEVAQTEEAKPRELEQREIEEFLARRSQLAKTDSFSAGQQFGQDVMRRNLDLELKSKKIIAENFRRAIKAYAKAHLTKGHRDKVNALADKAKDHDSFEKVIAKIDEMEAKYQKRKVIKELKKLKKRITPKEMFPEYRDKVHALIDGLDLVNRSDKKIIELQKLQEYVKKNPDHNIPDYKLDRLKELDKVQPQYMTTDDLKLIRDTLMHLEHLNLTRNKIRIRNRFHNYKSNRDKAIYAMDKAPVKNYDTFKGKKITLMSKTLTEWLNTEYLCKRLDGEEHGIIKTMIYDEIDRGESTALRYEFAAEDYLKKALEGIDPRPWSTVAGKPTEADYIKFTLLSGQPIKMTKAEAMSIYLTSFNKRGREHMMNDVKGGIHLRDNIRKEYKLASGDIERIGNALGLEEIKVAHAIFSYLNGPQREALNKTSVELNGWEIATEENYFPLHAFEPTDKPMASLDRTATTPRSLRHFIRKTLEGMGMLKPRKPGAREALIINDIFGEFFTSVQNTAKYTGYAQPLRVAKTLMNDPAFKDKLFEKFGENYWRTLNNWVIDMEDPPRLTEEGPKGINEFIRHLDVAVLGANPFVAVKQNISYMGAMLEMEPGHLFTAWGKPADKELIEQYSPQLKKRFRGFITKELGEAHHVAAARQFVTGKLTREQKFMSWVKGVDSWTIRQIWTAVEHETRDKHPDLKGDDFYREVATRTEEVVRLTQPTFHPKDRSPWGRSTDTFFRLFTKFHSQRNKNFMMLSRALDRYRQTKDLKKFSRDMLIMGFMVNLALYLVDSMRDWAYGREEDDKKFPWYIQVTKNLISDFYFVDVVFNSTISAMERGLYGGYDPENVLVSKVRKGIAGFVGLYQAKRQEAKGEIYEKGPKKYEAKAPHTRLRAIDNLLDGFLSFSGIPYKPLMSYFRMINEGKIKLEEATRPKTTREIYGGK